MGLEAAVHDRWAGDAALAALLPVERLFTGLALGKPELPYATLTRAGSRVRLRTSSGTRVEEVRLQLTLWTRDLDAGHAIVAAVDSVFDRAGFNAGADSVRQMTLGERRETQDASGVWQMSIELQALLQNNSNP